MSRSKTMVARVEAYLHARRQFGFQLRSEGRELLRFARYADGSKHHGAVTTELALRWAQLPSKATPLYRARRLEVVRCFAKYQVALEPKTEVPPSGILGRAHWRTTPYIFSPAQIARLVAAAERLAPPQGLRGQTYAALIALLACTGLRVSEALRLTRTDVDLDAGVLIVRRTKFRKSRLVPLHPSACAKLHGYVARRDASAPSIANATFFVSELGEGLPYRTVHGITRRLIDKIVVGCSDKLLLRRPRLHDLRHTFACGRLLQWYRDGANVDQRIAALSTYLGHGKVSDTYWYITAVPQLMAIAAARFERLGHEEGTYGADS